MNQQPAPVNAGPAGHVAQKHEVTSRRFGPGTRCGKVARLPGEVREVLNQRMWDGWSGRRLVRWLNGLEEVKAVLEREFGGRAIGEQNLSRWKAGGYREWLKQREVVEVSRQLGVEQVLGAGNGEGVGLSEPLSQWVAARYAVACRWVDEAEGAEGWKRLRQMSADVAELRRGDQKTRRLELREGRASVEGRRVEGRGDREERREEARGERERRGGEELAWVREQLELSFAALGEFMGENPAAWAALSQCYELARLPFAEGRREFGEAISRQITLNHGE